jgi:hypothetical protein
MLNRGFLAVTILNTVAWAADLRVSVPAGGQAETRILLSPSDLRTEQVLLVVANPRQVQVTVIGPDGRRWTQANSGEGSLVEMHLADRGGSSEQESMVYFLGSDATLVGWSKAAAAGTYSVQLSGKNLAAGAEIALRRMTLDELMQDRRAAAKRTEEAFMASMFAVPERRIRLDPQGTGSAILGPRPWDKSDIVMAGTTLGKKFAASVRMPDGTVVTEDNAVKMGCEWRWNREEDTPFESVLKIKNPHLWVSCPERMVGGAASISADAGAQTTGAEMAAAVVRLKGFASALTEDAK